MYVLQAGEVSIKKSFPVFLCLEADHLFKVNKLNMNFDKFL
jgi:hypothetical protein